MASRLILTRERRRTPRMRPGATQWDAAAILRPGQEVLLLDVSHGGALLESANRISPGSRGELQLAGDHRVLVRGRILRCQVARLNPVCYRAAIAFDEPLPLVSAGRDRPQDAHDQPAATGAGGRKGS